MRIAVGCDHRGYQTKERLKNFLTGLGHDVVRESATYIRRLLSIEQISSGLLHWTTPVDFTSHNTEISSQVQDNSSGFSLPGRKNR